MQEISLTAVIENIAVVTDQVDQLLESVDCPMKDQMQIDVALDELFSNIANYAYNPEIGDATVQFDFDEESRIFSLTFIDAGKPYDPLAKDDPDITLSAEDRPIGGLGIYIVKQTMDTVEYAYEDGKNILTVRKKI